jgi:N-glycosylase/DNA lyase
MKAEIVPPAPALTVLPVRDYDLESTLTCGQAFRWQLRDGGWEGVIGSQWVRLRGGSDGLHVETAPPRRDWSGLKVYLQTDVDLNSILLSFPEDEPMRCAVRACRGLRLLRQDPWECLASFILSSTKQIVQIRQIIGLLCERFGDPIPVPPGRAAVYSFPTAERIAACSESELRLCKMGFRAPHLLAGARQLAEGKLSLPGLAQRPVEEARAELL